MFEHRYVLGRRRPAPFGYDKSHSTFRLSDVTLNRANVTTSGTATAELKVRNNSTYSRTKAVKLYVKYKIPSAVTRNKEFKGFHEVSLRASEEKGARVLTNVAKLGAWNTSRYVVQKGEFVVAIWDSAEGIKSWALF